MTGHDKVTEKMISDLERGIREAKAIVDRLGPQMAGLKLRLFAATTHYGATTTEQFAEGWRIADEIWAELGPVFEEHREALRRLKLNGSRLQELRVSIDRDERRWSGRAIPVTLVASPDGSATVEMVEVLEMVPAHIVVP